MSIAQLFQVAVFLKKLSNQISSYICNVLPSLDSFNPQPDSKYKIL